MIVDSHQHFWNLDRVTYSWLTPELAPIYRTIEPPELAPQLSAAGVDRTVLVQSANSYADTEYMLEQADQYPWIGAVVGWVPLLEPDEAGRALDRFLQHRAFKGVRHLIHDEADPDWIVQDQAIAGLRELADRGVLFEVVAVFPRHLTHVPTLAERVPNLTMVIDHLAKPPFPSGDLSLWREQLAAAASYPQVYAKVSGLNTATNSATWQAADLQPGVDAALELFGVDRLMFGSDWPVCTLAGDYQRVWQATNENLAALSAAERAAVLGNTAARLYGIE